ncbi:MAG: FecR domain-containing protein [Opitutae bacterium]|nr:FecR domain-containing protein [Opitutae bacterium]
MSSPDASSPQNHAPITQEIRELASRWIVRRDRGLSAAEAIEFELWLAADERHAAAVRQADAAWAMLDRIPDDTARAALARPQRRSMAAWRWWGGLAAALALACGGWLWSSRNVPLPTVPISLDTNQARWRELPDGSTVRLNAGSEMSEAYTSTERRVRVTQGEAHFTVAKNPQRPFIVGVGDIEVRAVGTAFNVKVQAAAVEVLVTEGRVQVQASPPDSGVAARAEAAPVLPIIEANQRAIISRESAVKADIVVTPVRPEELIRELAWQSRLLRFGGATLAEVAVEFQQQTGYRIVLADPELALRRIGGRFRADNVEDFVRLLEEHFAVVSQRTPEGVIVLLKRP